MAKKKSEFGSAFADARKAGKSEFDYKGKKYNTKVKGDGKKSAKATPKSAPVPSSRSEAVKGMAKKDPSFSGLSDVAMTTPKKPKPTSVSVKASPPVTKKAETKPTETKKYKTVFGNKPIVERGKYTRT